MSGGTGATVAAEAPRRSHAQRVANAPLVWSSIWLAVWITALLHERLGGESDLRQTDAAEQEQARYRVLAATARLGEFFNLPPVTAAK